MDIDRDLDRMIDADLEDWKAGKHEVVFQYAGEYNDVVAGELYVDGRPVRVGTSGRSAWVNLTEARHIAARLGLTLRMA